MPTTISGAFTEIIFARFEVGEDVRQGLMKVIKDKNIKSGVVLTITGALERARLHRFRGVGSPGITTETVEMRGPLEVSGHGIIGQMDAPGFGKTPFGAEGEFMHGEPYLHVHLTATSAEQTICGHLMDGAIVRSTHPTSHFTVLIGRIGGAGVTMTGEPLPGNKARFGHELVKL
ncbi:MAG: DNA-binding protein [Betaproteobacteria bacterium]|nr:DNA-binding protein [Betaproteobacteria bacterium]